MRLIDADALMTKINKIAGSSAEVVAIRKIINDMPAVNNAAPITRCEQCEFFSTKSGHCAVSIDEYFDGGDALMDCAENKITNTDGKINAYELLDIIDRRLGWWKCEHQVEDDIAWMCWNRRMELEAIRITVERMLARNK